MRKIICVFLILSNVNVNAFALASESMFMFNDNSDKDSMCVLDDYWDDPYGGIEPPLSDAFQKVFARQIHLLRLQIQVGPDAREQLLERIKKSFKDKNMEIYDRVKEPKKVRFVLDSVEVNHYA